MSIIKRSKAALMLSLTLLALSIIVPTITANTASTQDNNGVATYWNNIEAGEPVKLTGGSAIELTPKPYDPVNYELYTMSRVDKDGDGLEDELAETISSVPSNETIKAIVTFAIKPAAFGGDPTSIKTSLKRVVSLIRNLGGKITAGPWTNAIVGLAFEAPASVFNLLANQLRFMDLNGDGINDRFLISLDKEVHAFNYWSSRQMAIRPWVWDNMGINGTNVTVVVIDTGIDDAVQAFPGDYPNGKIVYWADYVGDPNGNIRTTPYDDNMHGTHVAGTVAGNYWSFDDQGRLVFNFGISDLDFSGYDGSWLRFGGPYMAYYVNATGTIQFDFMWKSDTTATTTQGTIAAVGIGYCGQIPYWACSQNIVANVSTPNANTWYTVTYNVTSSDQFGWYYLTFQVGTGGGVAMLPILHFPVSTDYTTNVPYLAGMAPGAKLGGAKVLSYYGGGSTSNIVSAIDDVVGNRTLVDPPLYIISMSLGGSYDSNIDTAITNAANAGVLAVVAAGNDGAGTGTAASGSPASNPYAITVAAVNAFNNITDYSSDGGASTTDSSYIKPDIAAPGGGLDMMIFSADTTWHDDLLNSVTRLWWAFEDVDWSDTINVANNGYDDSLGISGTSMATPHVSGAAALVVDALVNHAGITWDFGSSSTAMLAKNILLACAVETYPLLREQNTTTYSPTLDKGGKDIHEGYGALDAHCAVQLALSLGAGKALLPGSVISEYLRTGTAYNADFDQGVWNLPFGPSAWGSRASFIESFKLGNGTTYNPQYGIALYLNTSNNAVADFDLYLYNIQGDGYGQPQIISSSTNGFGSDESVTFVPANAGVTDVFIVVKRAREDSIGGNFALSIGPRVDAIGIDPSWNQVDGQAWIGWPLQIKAMSALKAAKAYIEIYDNTTNSVLNSTIISLTDKGAYTYGEYEYTLPFDSTLVGHELIIITKYLDASNSVISGPVYDTVVVQEATQPVPEDSILIIAGIAVGILLVYILKKLT